MPRKIRVHYPGAIYHVMLRGNAGDRIFFNATDCKYFYKLIDEGVQRYHYRIHGFCLMSNHIHFALQVGEIPLSQIIQNIAFRYARMINRRKRRVGHVFQGRYKAILVDSDVYIKELIRYIHLNPVRAHIVSSVDQYRWSSHRAYLGFESFSWLTTDWLLSFFSENKREAMIRYSRYFMNEVSESMQKNFHIGNQKGYDILGDNDFLNKLSIKPILPINSLSFEKLLEIITNHYEIDIKELQSSSQKHRNSKIRAIIALLAKEMKITTLTVVARYFKRDMTGLIHSMRLLEKKPAFLEELTILEKLLKASRTQA